MRAAAGCSSDLCSQQAWRPRRYRRRQQAVFPLRKASNMVNLSLYSIKAVLLLDAEGNRVLAKYYGSDYSNLKEQKQFEKGLFDKTKRAQGKVHYPEWSLNVQLITLYCRRSYLVRQPSSFISLQH